MDHQPPGSSHQQLWLWNPQPLPTHPHGTCGHLWALSSQDFSRNGKCCLSLSLDSLLPFPSVSSLAQPMKLALYGLQRGLPCPSHLLKSQLSVPCRRPSPSLPQGLQGEALGSGQRSNASSSPSPLPVPSLRETAGPRLALAASSFCSAGGQRGAASHGPAQWAHLPRAHHALGRPARPCSDLGLATSFQCCDCGHVPCALYPH